MEVGRRDKKNGPVMGSLPCEKRANSKSCKEEKNREFPFPQLLCWSDHSQLKKIKFIVHKVKLQDALNCLKFKNELYVYVNLRGKKMSHNLVLFLGVLETCMNVLARVSTREFTWGIRNFTPILKTEGCPSFNTQTIFTPFFSSFDQRNQSTKLSLCYSRQSRCP